MEKQEKFKRIGFLGRFWFKTTTLTISSVITAIILVTLLLFHGNYGYSIPVTWTAINLIFILGFGIYLLYLLKLNINNLFAIGFLLLIIGAITNPILPPLTPREYTALRLTDGEGFIISDEICKKGCGVIARKVKEGANVERDFYSWKLAHLLGRFTVDDPCCFDYPIQISFLFGLFIVLEITFEFLPYVLSLSILLSMYEVFLGQPSRSFGSDLITKDDFSFSQVNLTGAVIILIVMFYNLFYISEF